MKAFITGHLGFVGKYLSDYLDCRGYSVIGFDAKNGNNILNYESLRTVLDNYRPDEIYHLAAQAFVPESFSSPQRTIDINVNGAINLLEAVKNLGIKPKILLACSSEEYGFVAPEECPINECQPLRPMSPYGVSKVAMDMLGDWYAKYHGLHVVRTRAFNHEGAGRGEMYVTSSFAKQVAEIEKYGGVLRHGNLDAKRDFTDVRDMVKAYTMAIKLEPDVYNIGRGEALRIEELVKILVSQSKVKINMMPDPSRMRKTDVPLLVCDNSKFVKLTGWKPKYNIAQTMSCLLDYWRERV